MTTPSSGYFNAIKKPTQDKVGETKRKKENQGSGPTGHEMVHRH
jgi:hypothetical protein